MEHSAWRWEEVKVPKTGKKQNLEQIESIFVFWIDSSSEFLSLFPTRRQLLWDYTLSEYDTYAKCQSAKYAMEKKHVPRMEND